MTHPKKGTPPGAPSSRRKLFSTLTKGSFAGAALFAGLFQAEPAHAIRRVKCCELEFNNNCPDLSCFRSGNDWWVWSCCYGGLVYNCYECYTRECSLANYPGSCHCSAPDGRKVREAAC